MTVLENEPADPNSIGYRLYEERRRLRLTEAEMAERAGFALDSAPDKKWHRVRALETGTNAQNKPLTWDELAGLATLGVDVQYVLIGQRSHVLSQEEQRLVDNYRASGEEGKRSLRSVGNAFAKSRLDDDDAVVGGG